MSGICGVYKREGPAPDKALLERMTAVLGHRGPDASYYLSHRLALGTRGSGIASLGHPCQQTSTEEVSVTAVCDGTIYNYVDLIQELDKKGYQLHSRCHAQTIACAYEEYGEEFAEKLRGDFAIALWDPRIGKLILARDRLGIKPLYFCSSKSRLLFASEIKAILEDPSVERRVDLEALDLYLTFGFIPAPKTMFEGIWKLLPGHSFVNEVDSFYFLPHREAVAAETPLGTNEYGEELRHLLREAVRRRMKSDRPAGIVLSSGMDSAALVALMLEVSGERPKTFSLNFDSTPGSKKSSYERLVADHFDTDHQELTIGASDYQGALSDCLWHIDEPIVDVTAVPLYLLSRHAASDAKVLMIGEGVNELFGGHMRHWGRKTCASLPAAAHPAYAERDSRSRALTAGQPRNKEGCALPGDQRCRSQVLRLA